MRAPKTSISLRHPTAVLGGLLVLLAITLAPAPAADTQAETGPSTAGFRDGIKHYQDKSDRSDYARYRDEQTREIADNLLLYQRANGGWQANIDPLRILNEDERRQLQFERGNEDTSLDNHATSPNVEYLAWAFVQTNDVRYQAACLQGIEFLLKAQYANGGWPHSWPSQRDYRPRITLIDGVMVGVLKTLHRAAERRAPFQWLPAELVERVREAAGHGDRCLLALQVKRDGVLTGWASQYDEKSLRPTQGRSYELPALISSETVNVLEYLMSFESPSDDMVTAIRAGARWLEESKIRGLRIERIKAETVRYQNHTSRDDVVAVDDPHAPPIWARFYDLETNEPVLANRDGRRVTRLSEIERERRTGYSWYGGYAQRFLETTYPAWCALHCRSATVRAESP